MKTPEEIKKGLELCTSKCIINLACPYNEHGDGCAIYLNKDALAYIQQLEYELSEIREYYDCSDVANTELHSALYAMKRERDAAVEDIFHMCANCKHEKLGYGVGPCPPIEEYLTNDCSNWEWRGVPQEVE